MTQLLQVHSLMGWHHGLAAGASQLEGLPSSAWFLRGCVLLPTNSLPTSVIPDRGLSVSKIKISYKVSESKCLDRGEQCIHREELVSLCYTGIRRSLRQRDAGNPVQGIAFKRESFPFKQEREFPNDMFIFFSIYS